MQKTKVFRTCAFCEIHRLGKDVFFETKYFYGHFDAFPVTPGHAEVIPKEHVESLLELKKEEWLDLQKAISKMVHAIEKTNLEIMYKKLIKKPINKSSEKFYAMILMSPNLKKKPDGYNFGVNDGKAAGRTVHHLHIHVIPRHFGDSPDPNGGISGIRNIIPSMAHYKNRFK